MWKTVLFQTIQFCISTQFRSIWPIDRALWGAITLGQSGPGSDGNEGVLRISKSSSITVASPSDCFMSNPEQSLGWGGLTSLQRSSRCILQPQSTGQQMSSGSLKMLPTNYSLTSHISNIIYIFIVTRKYDTRIHLTVSGR